ncbi:MAG: acyl-CoA dehydrogenase family protein [Myxococcota bacterium]|nr:acyl-CoA dehydrogenase family protein [Myxococcota bacterium]
MDFGFSDEQELLRGEARKLLDDACPLDEVRLLQETPAGHSPELWKQLGELGWLGLIVPEVHGGAGLGWLDLIVLLEETGRSLFPGPLVSNTLAAATLCDAANDEQRAQWLPGLADGSRIGTVALLDEREAFRPDAIRLSGQHDGDGWRLTGEKRFVTDPTSADLFVVAFRTGDASEALALGVIEGGAPGLSAQSFPTLDATRRLGNLVLSDVRIADAAVLGTAGEAWPAIERLLDRGATAVAAEMLGAAQAALDLTVQYAKDRVQFGSPIGRFQGVKHPLAEMHVQLESARSLLYYAAWALDESPDDVPRAASRAKALMTEAFSRIGTDAIQLHGTLAYTEEYPAQLYYKRSKLVRPLFGDSDHHYDRLLRLRGL